MNSYRPFLIIAVVLLVAAAGTALLRESNKSREASAGESSSESGKDIPPHTVVTLEEFGDYQCPACGQLHPTLKKLKQDHDANLVIIFRNLPLTTLHPNAL